MAIALVSLAFDFGRKSGSRTGALRRRVEAIERTHVSTTPGAPPQEKSPPYESALGLLREEMGDWYVDLIIGKALANVLLCQSGKKKRAAAVPTSGESGASDEDSDDEGSDVGSDEDDASGDDEGSDDDASGGDEGSDDDASGGDDDASGGESDTASGGESDTASGGDGAEQKTGGPTGPGAAGFEADEECSEPDSELEPGP